MSAAYSYNGTAVDTSTAVKKKTNYSLPVTIVCSGVSVLADAIKIQIKDNQDVFAPMANLEFGEGLNSFNLHTGMEFKIDVDNGGVNNITVDVYV